MTVTATFDDVLSRVIIECTAGMADAETGRVERSLNGVAWTTVRGGVAVPSTDGDSLDAAVSDYEFSPGVVNTYRVVTGTSTVVPDPVTITPTLDTVWIKSIVRPYLNQPVTVTDYSDVSRAARTSVFDVIGAGAPIAVTDNMSASRFNLEIMTDGADEERRLDLALAPGDVMFVHVPRGGRVPGGYVAIGDASRVRRTAHARRRYWNIPCTVVRAPSPDVYGVTGTWASVLATYATWADLMAAHPTWASVLALVGSPEDIEVG